MVIGNSLIIARLVTLSRENTRCQTKHTNILGKVCYLANQYLVSISGLSRNLIPMVFPRIFDARENRINLVDHRKNNCDVHINEIARINVILIISPIAYTLDFVMQLP